jgi:hypothetical protein
VFDKALEGALRDFLREKLEASDTRPVMVARSEIEEWGKERWLNINDSALLFEEMKERRVWIGDYRGGGGRHRWHEAWITDVR